VLNLGSLEKLARRIDIEYSYRRQKLTREEYREEIFKLGIEERFKKRETVKE
jgi:hypothetical protein